MSKFRLWNVLFLPFSELSLYELHRTPQEAITDGTEISISPRSLHSELMCPICLDMLKNTMTTKEVGHRFSWLIEMTRKFKCNVLIFKIVHVQYILNSYSLSQMWIIGCQMSQTKRGKTENKNTFIKYEENCSILIWRSSTSSWTILSRIVY